MTRLIDTHQHLIYPSQMDYGWTEGVPELANQAFPVELYRDLSAEADLAGSLFMEVGVDDSDFQDETRFIADLAKSGTSGILGIVSSCRPELDAGFSDWLDECDLLGVSGYRRILHVMPDEISTTEVFRRNVRKIGDRGLPFDLCLLARQLPIGVDLARACENTQMVLNHCGVPDIAGGGLDPWRDHIRELSRLPNLNCKLSGILAYCAPGTSELETIRPYVDHVLECFGPARMVWGSDWPVVNMGADLPTWIGITQSILSELSESEAAAIGSENAKRIYRLNA